MFARSVATVLASWVAISLLSVTSWRVSLASFKVAFNVSNSASWRVLLASFAVSTAETADSLAWIRGFISLRSFNENSDIWSESVSFVHSFSLASR